MVLVIMEDMNDEDSVKALTEIKAELSAAQRARIERNRQRARALHDARLVQRPHEVGEDKKCKALPSAPHPTDSGGGFLLEEDECVEPAARAAAPSAPFVHRSEQPPCQRCERPFPQSYLLDTFGLEVCDACRDDDEEHALITRTEAKAEYLLKDCDLDAREPPLRCVRRRNPHSARYGDMRLYLRAQVEARALLVWGSPHAVEEERARRQEARARTRHTQARRRLRALRMDVRSSLYERTSAHHRHEFGAEQYDAAADRYQRTCLACPHTETYEKM